MEVSSKEDEKFLKYFAFMDKMECREREMYYWSNHVHGYEYMRKVEALRNENK